MSKCVNKVTLIGYLGGDPEAIQTNTAKKILILQLATSETWNDKKSGEKKENTDWHKVILYNSNAEIAQKYLKKGDKVYIEGKIKTSFQENNDKKIKYTVIQASDLQILESREKNDKNPKKEVA